MICARWTVDPIALWPPTGWMRILALGVTVMRRDGRMWFRPAAAVRSLQTGDSERMRMNRQVALMAGAGLGAAVCGVVRGE